MEGELAAGQGKGEGDSKTRKGGWSTIKGDGVEGQERGRLLQDKGKEG
jgi:hypothetical protein